MTRRAARLFALRVVLLLAEVDQVCLRLVKRSPDGSRCPVVRSTRSAWNVHTAGGVHDYEKLGC